MNKFLTIILAILQFSLAYGQKTGKNVPYKNPQLPVEQRLDDLMGRMMLEEKLGQLRCTLAWDYYERKGKDILLSESFKKDVAENHIGMLWATFRADPWTQKSFDNGLNPVMAARLSNLLQRYAIEHSRLGIPLFLAEEAPHGHMAIGTTVFPTGLGMAATWSPELIERVGNVIGREIRLQGAHISYGPVVDLCRDPRWSRMEETMGEDPVLAGEIGAAMVRGLGRGDLSRPYSTLATVKHFIGYGTTEGGHNGNPTVVGTRDLYENFLPPFKRMVDEGALSIMTSYNSWDGIPSTCNGFLLTDILRDEWKFKGFVVSDLYSINCIYHDHRVASSIQDAGMMALKAGVDVDLGAIAYGTLDEAVKNGKIDEAFVDKAVRRVLRMKFEMGLFEHPYVEPKAAANVCNEADRKLALDVARASITLLKNNKGVLPLRKDMRIAVIGPNADNCYNQLGDYTAPQEEGRVKTLLDGVCQKVGADAVEYVKGCAVRDTQNVDIDAAVDAALRADVVVVAVGGSSARDFKTSYLDTGAAKTDNPSISDMDCGEGFDRSTLDLLGRQNELLRALKRTGKPLVVVYIEGRPLDKRWASENADALLTAYYPGQEGGLAIADVLFGDYNPAGRLPVSIPRHVGQLPVYYNHKSPAPHDYMDLSARPLYSFGYGLSYTTFIYNNLTIERQGEREMKISFDVTNTGKYDGEEVAQLYLHKAVASTVQPEKQLKCFRRVMIHKGETRHFEFVLGQEELSIIDRQMNRVTEPGEYDVMIGPSSDDIALKGKFVY